VISALTAAGSTPRWRRTRAAILDRDRWRCQLCGRPATTVGHIRARRDGGDDRWSNLRAECAPCNYRGGADMTNSRARPPPTPTRW